MGVMQQIDDSIQRIRKDARFDAVTESADQPGSAPEDTVSRPIGPLRGQGAYGGRWRFRTPDPPGVSGVLYR